MSQLGLVKQISS